jgi:hypothetical protein
MKMIFKQWKASDFTEHLINANSKINFKGNSQVRRDILLQD